MKLRRNCGVFVFSSRFVSKALKSSKSPLSRLVSLPKQQVRNAHMVKNLSFPPSALEPKLASTLLKQHWTKYAKQVVELNEILDQSFPSTSTLVESIREFGSHADTALEYHLACESYAHEFYFNGFTDMPARRIIGARLLQEIELQFDGVENLKTLLAHHVSGLFGQGWIWIVAYDGQLEILTVGPGDSFLVRPDSDKMIPIFALDAWEHAYYTHFGTDVASYVEAWWSCLDMVQAEEALLPALQQAGLD